MNTLGKTLSVFLVALVGAGLWFGMARHKGLGNVAPKVANTVTAAPASSGKALPSAPSAAMSREKSAPLAVRPGNDYAKQLRESKNYRTFIDRALEAARNGDRDAEYYLSAAMAYCDETNRFFFKRGNRTLSVDEAITDRERFPGPSMTSAIRRADDRCHDVNDVKDPIWGTADSWLAKAAAAGQPVAEIRTAEKALLAIATRGSTTIEEPNAPGETFTVSDARSLVRTAVESNNPEVIFEMGSLLGLVKPRQQAQTNTLQETLTWEYAACLQGMDCSADADWYTGMCLSDPNCRPDESGIDYLQRNARQVNMLDLEERAKALNTTLNAKAWDELGLGE
jgi:hypothetical protein